MPEGRRTRYELTDPRISHALGDLLDMVLVVDPSCCGGKEHNHPATAAARNGTQVPA